MNDVITHQMVHDGVGCLVIRGRFFVHESTRVTVAPVIFPWAAGKMYLNYKEKWCAIR